MTAVIHVAFCLLFRPGNIFSVKANPTYKEVHDTMKREWPNDKDTAAEKVYLRLLDAEIAPCQPCHAFQPCEMPVQFFLVMFICG